VGVRRKREEGKATGGGVTAEQGEPSQGKSLAKLSAREDQGGWGEFVEGMSVNYPIVCGNASIS
jgi:hypothetical protein